MRHTKRINGTVLGEGLVSASHVDAEAASRVCAREAEISARVVKVDMSAKEMSNASAQELTI